MNRIIVAIVFIAGMFMTCPVVAQKYDGLASYYGPDFHGRRTANGSVYNMHEYTCAHKTLPFGTKIKVTNLNNNKSVVVKVTDRGPYRRGRVIDLSIAAAKDIDMLHKGVAPISFEIVKEEEDIQLPMTANNKEWEPVKKTIDFKLEFEKLDKEFTFPNPIHGHQVS